ncbi:c-type cytochrome [Sulfitobacter sp. S190]|uniref:c-type cytochrome n=1 Tax=Sulfitobacter sp. S190 TaxID=2867022 RepID=UPI0021A34DEA|nr:c-type cytochrome [Sulfitobacter sp. S190]UWR24339.1 hypothetical protein K3756_17515 [Sulfitobacter sp. S190]
MPQAALAEGKRVALHAPQELQDTGVLKYALPRFSLKTQISVALVPPADADILLGAQGTPLFQGPAQLWHMDIRTVGDTDVDRLADWLTGEVGQRTILAFAPEGVPLFTAPQKIAKAAAQVSYDGDAIAGYAIAQAKCGRCHAVDEAGRKNDIGSTPSFFVLRAFSDWEQRFAGFYFLNPHPAFTQVADVTDPFAEDLPPAIVPVEMTLDDLEAMMAFVAEMAPADLGAPLQHQ